MTTITAEPTTEVDVETGPTTDDVNRVVYDAIDHYLGVLCQDIRDGGEIGERAKVDAMIAEALLVQMAYVVAGVDMPDPEPRA